MPEPLKSQSIFFMEKFNSKNLYNNPISKVLRFIALYAFGFLIIRILNKETHILDNLSLKPIIIVPICLLLPLIWALSRNFIKGALIFLSSLFILYIVTPLVFSKTKTINSETLNIQQNYNGIYTSNENGLRVNIIINDSTWNGEVIEDNTGSTISSEYGQFKDGKLYDKYDNEIGNTLDNSIYVTIAEKRVHLDKK